jgi:hypothetical protein
MVFERRTSIAIEHALDLLQVLADLFAGLGGGNHIGVCSVTDAVFGVDVAHLFPRLTRRGRLEFEDVVSQAAHEIGRRALLRLEKVHGVGAAGEGKTDGGCARGSEGRKEGAEKGEVTV